MCFTLWFLCWYVLKSTECPLLVPFFTDNRPLLRISALKYDLLVIKITEYNPTGKPILGSQEMYSCYGLAVTAVAARWPDVS